MISSTNTSDKDDEESTNEDSRVNSQHCSRIVSNSEQNFLREEKMDFSSDSFDLFPKININDLPFLVIEYILSHFTYYQILQLRLVSSRWNTVIKEYLRKANQSFLYNLSKYRVQWVAVKEQIEDFNQSSEDADNSLKKKSRSIPKMSPRYHHSACYINEYMYVFGGCMSPFTAYNDLWRFDVKSKTWHRIIAEGTIPLPRLFASFTLYEFKDQATNVQKQYIVLFGGILFNGKFDIKSRLLSTIHFFDINNNRWTLINVQGNIQLKSYQHSATIIGDELIIFNGYRTIDNIEIDSNEVYVFDLKKHSWRLQKTKIISELNTAKTTWDSYRNLYLLRRKNFPTPFVLDSHNILYICDTTLSCSTSVMFLAAFVLKRTDCYQKSCNECQNNDPDKESIWEWAQVDLTKIGLDFEYMYGGEFCKIGNLLAYLTFKNIVQVEKQLSTTSIDTPLPASQREHISHANKRLLRERRIETLDFYKRHFENRKLVVSNKDDPPAGPVFQKVTLQLRLLDTSRVISEKKLYRIKQCHEIDYTVAPDPFSCYSLVATPESLILFGGYSFDQQKEKKVVSNKIFMLVSKPEIKLY